MDEHQRGNLFLGKIPDRGVENKVISYLLNLRQGSSPEVITAKVKKAPLVLFRDISAHRALMIAADLEQLGAGTTFVPFKSDRQKADRDESDRQKADRDEGPTRTRTPFADPSTPPRSKKSRPTPSSKRGPQKRGSVLTGNNQKRLRLVLLLVLLLISLAFLAWQKAPLFSTAYDRYLLNENPKSRQSPRQDSGSIGPDKGKSSLIIEVPSPDKTDSKDLDNPGK